MTTPRKPTIAPGTHVTNAKGWTGVIVRIDEDETCENCPYGRYYWISWKEREQSSDKMIAARPIIGHLRTQFDVLSHTGDSHE